MHNLDEIFKISFWQSSMVLGPPLFSCTLEINHYMVYVFLVLVPAYLSQWTVQMYLLLFRLQAYVGGRERGKEHMCLVKPTAAYHMSPI